MGSGHDDTRGGSVTLVGYFKDEFEVWPIPWYFRPLATEQK
jgi:hypothetical protein